jgi:HAD superfamily hydrolase (TIGR01490 family)
MGGLMNLGGKPVVAFFDMDHTIIGIDCSVSWKYFLADHGLAPEDDKAKADHYWQLYCQGSTPIDEFVKFQYREFSGKTVDEMRSLARCHFEERIRSYIYRGAQEKIREFSRDGIPTVLVTGTNQYIAEPIVEAMEITALLATEPEIVEGKFTGWYIPPFLLKEAKITMAERYCRELGVHLDKASFFGDSVNDLDMLKKVGYPSVVNPGEKVLVVAEKSSWPVKRWVV